MKSPAAVSAKKRHSGGGGAGFALGCGCKATKSVSVSTSPSPSPSPSPSATTTGTSSKTARRRSGAGTTTTTTTTDTLTTSASSSSLWEDAVAELRCRNGDTTCPRCPQVSSVASTPASFSGLLHELSELEKSVASWGARKVVHHDDDEEEKLSSPHPPQEHRKPKGGDIRVVAKENQPAEVDGAGRLEGSVVAVVKHSFDPHGDFRRSMLQLIVENGIVAGEDLREMLRRFLALNAPHHHDAILRAFAEIWDDVFVAAFLDDDSAAAATPSRGRGPVLFGRELLGTPPVPGRTPPRHRRSPPAWRV